jgi:hypothetical protein
MLEFLKKNLKQRVVEAFELNLSILEKKRFDQEMENCHH